MISVVQNCAFPEVVPSIRVPRWATELSLSEAPVGPVCFKFAYRLVVGSVLFHYSLLPFRQTRRTTGFRQMLLKTLCTADQHFHDSTGNRLPSSLACRTRRCTSTLFQRDFPTGNRFGWSFFFAMCHKSTAHEQHRSRGESRKLRFGSNRSAQKFDRRDTKTVEKAGKKKLFKFSSLSAPTKMEELRAGSDEKTQRSPAGIPGGAALCFPARESNPGSCE